MRPGGAGQWRRGPNGAVAARLAVAAGCCARVVLVAARRAVLALTLPGAGAKGPGAAASACVAASSVADTE